MIAPRLVDYLHSSRQKKRKDPKQSIVQSMRALASTEEDQGFLLRIKTEPFSCSFLRTEEYFLPDRIPCESRLS
jgi:phage I-like protein